MNIRLVMSIGLVFALLASSAHAVMYRYKDDQGRTVMSATVPPEIVPKGYDVLNAQGRIIETVAPALTAEQIRARDEAIEREKREEEERKAQELADQKLLKQYGSPETVVNLMNRRLGEIESVIVSREAAIQAAKNSIAVNEEKAANFQRNGRAIPAIVKQELEKAKDDIVKAQTVIADKKKDHQAVKEEFGQIIERLEFLTNTKASSKQ
jgi:hypothetical protein